MSLSREKKGAIIIEGHVQGLANTRALGKEGVPVIVVDRGSCVASSSKYCRAFYQCPDYKSDEFVDFLIKLGAEKNLKGWILLPSNDHAVYSISKHLNRILSIFKTTIPDLTTINNIYNKANLLAIASKVEVPIPQTFYFTEISEVKESSLKYPVLTKGKQGLDFYKTLGKKALLSDNKSELQLQLKTIGEVFPLENTFTQELIPFDGTNKTISLAAFCINGEIKSYWMGAKLREHPLQFGTATFTESIYEEACLVSSRRLLKELNYTGICEVEFLKDPSDGDFKLIEINARTWLWVGHAVANGVNFPLMTYNYLNNIPFNYPASYNIGLKWRNPISDLVFSIVGIIKGVYSFRNLIEGNRGKIVDSLYAADDTKPFFKYAFLMLNFLKNR